MLGEQPNGTPSSAGFPTAWCATDLGEFRPCRHTYAYYPYESLPPLDSGQYTGTFPWLGGVGDLMPEQSLEVGRLERDLEVNGLSLPRDFIAFQTGANSYAALDRVSVTACWTDLSKPLASPFEPGAYLVRFLRDQQSCVLWYLYLRPSGEVFVVHSDLDFKEAQPTQDVGEGAAIDLDDVQEQRAMTYWCAPSFEEFAHRFWIENRLWWLIARDQLAQLEPALRDYLGHYASP